MAPSTGTAPTVDANLCPRCKVNVAVAKSRSDAMCAECFSKYVAGKVLKRMEAYKFRKDVPQRKVLLALSLGVSSLTLLHHVTKFLRMSVDRIGLCGYDLHICIMNDTSVFSKDAKSDSEDDERVRRISDLYFDDRERWPMVKSVIYKSTEEMFNSMSKEDPVYKDLFGASQPTDSSHQTIPDPDQRYKSYIASLPSSSERTDVNSILTRRFIIHEAQQAGCDSIFWGDTTTRLAERTLAEAAKGRGFSLPWQTSDGPTPYGLAFVHPMRDLLRKEVLVFSELVEPSLASLAKPNVSIGVPQASSKDATIDALMVQYFESVEENFPSIVTNVVRTSNRLQPPSSQLEGTNVCQICALPVADGNDGLHGWAGSQEDDFVESPRGFYCYGCARSMKGIKT